MAHALESDLSTCGAWLVSCYLVLIFFFGGTLSDDIANWYDGWE